MVAVAVEKAGATRGALVRERERGLWVDAVCDVRGMKSMKSLEIADAPRLVEATGLPASIIRFVRRTQETLVLSDATLDQCSSNEPF